MDIGEKIRNAKVLGIPYIAIIGNNTEVVVLAHLSEVNNTEEKALEEFNSNENNRRVKKVILGKPKDTTELIEV